MNRMSEVAVMVLQVERQAEYSLITVTVQYHVGRSLTFAEPPVPRKVADAGEALQLARDFLEAHS